MRAVILTAGEGTRMRPLTLTRPKTMLPVGGKPLLEYNVEALRDAGIKNITMIVGYQKEAVMEHFKDGESLGVNITYVIQEERLGTAHAIGQVANLAGNNKDAIIVTNGDIILENELIKSLMDKYHQSHAQSILVLTEVEDPSAFGVVELEGDCIRDIVEKPNPGEAPSNLINAGIYLFDPSIFQAIEKTEKSERGEYEITDSLKTRSRDKQV